MYNYVIAVLHPLNLGYKILSKIGEGSFSDVLKCQELETGLLYACKRLKKFYSSANQMNDIPEVMALQKMSCHPNVIHLVEAIYESNPGCVIMVFELCDISLYDLMKTKKRGLPETQVRDYIYQLLRGLEFIHKNGIFHRDVKPENVLLKGNMVKLGDLGSVRGINSHPPYTEYVSTRWYRSPECLLTTGFYGPKMDIWAVGCIFFELLTLKPLFPGTNEMDQIHHIHSIIGVPTTRTMEKFRKHKSYNYECAFLWGKSKNQLKNKSDHWGYGIFHSNPEEYSSSSSLPSFPKYNQSFSFGYFKLFSMLKNLSEPGREILKQMLAYDPDLRCSAHRAIEHHYFNLYREHEISPRKYHCCPEIPSRNPNQTYEVLSQKNFKESSPRKFINKPTIVGNIKQLNHVSYHIANKITYEDKREKPKDQWHLPMISEKCREKQIADKSSWKGTHIPKINRFPTNAMEQVIHSTQTKNVIFPKICLKEEKFEKCKECKKLKLVKNVGSTRMVKPREGQCGDKVYKNSTKGSGIKSVIGKKPKTLSKLS